MKNFKKIVMGILTAALVTSAFVQYDAYANEGDSLMFAPADMQAADIEEDVNDMQVGTENHVNESYMSIRGKVLSITPMENNGSAIALDEEGNEVQNALINGYFVLLETEGNGMVNFVVTGKTIFPKGAEIAEGDIVTGFYDVNLPALMIYPPQYHADVMAVGVGAEESIFVGRFDENFVSSDNQLKLNISSETEIVFEDGLPFSEGFPVDDEAAAIANMKLIVLYTVSTRSIPAQTTPQKIIVPYSNIITPLAELDDYGNALMFDIINYPIIVEDKVISDYNAYVKDGIVMIPLRAVSEALGFEVSWDDSSRSVSIGELAALIIGEDSYQLGAAPEIVIDRSYVPISFFRDVLLVNNAYVFEGQIVINNQEQMN